MQVVPSENNPQGKLNKWAGGLNLSGLLKL